MFNPIRVKIRTCQTLLTDKSKERLFNGTNWHQCVHCLRLVKAKKCFYRNVNKSKKKLKKSIQRNKIVLDLIFSLLKEFQSYKKNKFST